MLNVTKKTTFVYKGMRKAAKVPGVLYRKISVLWKVIKAPDFICIGAQKAGTSWLHWNLLFHPDTEMPPEKEINFFYPPTPPVDQLLNDEIELEALISKHNDLNPETWMKRYLNLQQAIKTKNQKFPIEWWKKSLFLSRTPENYIKLFKRSRRKISGDMSPCYAHMPDEEISKLVKAAPKAKIIFLMRHPIERSWSQFKMVNKNLILSNPTEEEILNKIMENSYRYTGFSLYTEQLDRWERLCPNELKVWFYDHLCENPKEFFGEICEYIQIRPIFTFPNNKINQRVHDSETHPMPKLVYQFFQEKLTDEILKLHQRFNNRYTQRWVDSLQK